MQALRIIWTVASISKTMEHNVTILRQTELTLSRLFRAMEDGGEVLKRARRNPEIQRLLGERVISHCTPMQFKLSPFQLREMEIIVGALENTAVTFLGVRVDQGLFVTVVGLLLTNVVSIVGKGIGAA